MRCQNEVEQLHMFFQDWLTGAAEDNDANFARLSNVLASDFVMVAPDGQIHDRDGTLTVLRGAHGSRNADAFQIWVEDFQLRLAHGPLGLAGYREWQLVDDEKSCRMSTALFRACDTTPNRVEWVHLHETWLPVPNDG